RSRRQVVPKHPQILRIRRARPFHPDARVARQRRDLVTTVLPQNPRSGGLGRKARTRSFSVLPAAESLRNDLAYARSLLTDSTVRTAVRASRRTVVRSSGTPVRRPVR